MSLVYWICFFKHKTAYEWRISDWSSDVCSSDLIKGRQIEHVRRLRDRTRGASEVADRAETALIENVGRVRRDHELAGVMRRIEIGRASCRERVCQYV